MQRRGALPFLVSRAHPKPPKLTPFHGFRVFTPPNPLSRRAFSFSMPSSKFFAFLQSHKSMNRCWMVRYVKDADSDENGAVLENNCPAKERKHNMFGVLRRYQGPV
jgi:hypothetical protein